MSPRSGSVDRSAERQRRVGTQRPRAPSGHVFCVERRRGPVWYVKYRSGDGRQVQRKLGPAWPEDADHEPPVGYFTKRTAELWLRETLDVLRRRSPTGRVRVRFAEAAAEWLRYVEHDRERKPNTVMGYEAIVRAHLLPAFGDRRLATITAEDVERWLRSLDRAPTTRAKALVCLHAIFRRAQRVWGVTLNPAAEVDKPTLRRTGEIEVLEPQEVMALVRAAANERDAAIYLVAAFTGLRMGELLALRWRDVDFDASVVRVRASFSGGQLTSPKSGKVRSVPMAPQVASALTRYDRAMDPSITRDSSSSVGPADFSTDQRCVGATAAPCVQPTFVPCGSTTYVTPSARG